MKRTPYPLEKLSEKTRAQYEYKYKFGEKCTRCGGNKAVLAWKMCEKCMDFLEPR